MRKLDRPRGMTLMELMIVVAILATVATIAVSSYRSYMLRANRTEATLWLMRLTTAQEKFFLQNNTYADNDLLTTAPPAGLGLLATTPTGLYRLDIINFTPTTYTARASAINGQVADADECHVLTINESSQRTAPAHCWR